MNQGFSRNIAVSIDLFVVVRKIRSYDHRAMPDFLYISCIL